jgi:hypothetical protein
MIKLKQEIKETIIFSHDIYIPLYIVVREGTHEHVYSIRANCSKTYVFKNGQFMSTFRTAV